VPLYRLKGYVEIERIAVPLKNGEALPVVKMVKSAKLLDSIELGHERIPS
jgi:hypothetical protein